MAIHLFVVEIFQFGPRLWTDCLTLAFTEPDTGLADDNLHCSVIHTQIIEEKTNLKPVFRAGVSQY